MENKRILVVDDSNNLRASLRMLLEAQGCFVAEAGDGYEALEKLEKGDFDLIISDYDMPSMGGIELLRELKKKGINIPVIIRSTDDVGAEAYAAGAKEFVSKQRMAKDLLEVIHKVLKDRADSPIDDGAKERMYMAMKIISHGDGGKELYHLRDKLSGINSINSTMEYIMKGKEDDQYIYKLLVHLVDNMINVLVKRLVSLVNDIKGKNSNSINEKEISELIRIKEDLDNLLLSFTGMKQSCKGGQSDENLVLLDEALKEIISFLSWAVNFVKGDMRREDINLKELFEEMIKELFQSHKPIISKISVGIDERIVISGDRYGLRLGIPRIISNMLHYEVEHIDISAYAQGGNTVIVITDDGPGFSSDNLTKDTSGKPRICELGYTKREYGTGLGLALLWEVIRQHKGKVRAENRGGGKSGARFIIEITICSSALEAASSSPAGENAKYFNICYLMRNPSGSNIMSFPLMSDCDSLAKRSLRALIIRDALGGCILIRIIPGYSAGRYVNISAKCKSWVNIILWVYFASRAIFSSSSAEGTIIISCPAAVRNSRTSRRIFSSMRSLISADSGKGNKFSGLDYLGGIMQGRLNMFFGKLRVGLFYDLIWGFSSLKHFKHQVYHYAAVFKAGLSMTYFWVYRYIIGIVHFMSPSTIKFTLFFDRSQDECVKNISYFSPAQAQKSAGCCVRTGVRTEGIAGWNNFMEALGFKAGGVYPAVNEIYVRISRAKRAVLFSNFRLIFCRGPP